MEYSYTALLPAQARGSLSDIMLPKVSRSTKSSRLTANSSPCSTGALDVVEHTDGCEHTIGLPIGVNPWTLACCPTFNVPNASTYVVRQRLSAGTAHALLEKFKLQCCPNMSDRLGPWDVIRLITPHCFTPRTAMTGARLGIDWLKSIL